mmetsp:Transcript_11524/g.23448  ORF Transcript_11524/g.23448 Transcript_11524/m.23448 type:complete len:117 (-) Transcript_11524:4146-4496(-)
MSFSVDESSATFLINVIPFSTGPIQNQWRGSLVESQCYVFAGMVRQGHHASSILQNRCYETHGEYFDSIAYGKLSITGVAEPISFNNVFYGTCHVGCRMEPQSASMGEYADGIRSV